VGSVQPHKGSRVFAEVVDGLTPAERRRFELSAYGGGDAAELAALSRRGVAVRGYYRAGGLPARLRRDRIDLALVPSIYPEPYGLTVDECLAAGVPVVAFDHGAIPARLRRRDGGWLVPPAEGAAGILRLLRELPQRERWPRPKALAAGPGDAGAPLDYADLYLRILGERGPASS
jgi:glycosyltransferase involved in cell wall biosynthesis